MKRDAAALLARLEFEVPVDARMEELSLAQIQLVEIAKALSREADVIIMDEPTSAIGEHEAHILFKAILTLIVGHELEPQQSSELRNTGRTILQVQQLSRSRWFENISLDIAAGEIVGIYGLLGSGRTEFLETVYGLHKPDSGQVILEGKVLVPGNPKASIEAGMTMVPEDRKQTGLVLNSSIANNITLSAIPKLSARGFVKRGLVAAIVSRMIGEQRIKCSSPDLAVESLSGGNQQKVVLARCLTTQPTLLICDEPTRGIDEGAKQEIYRFLREFVSQGNAVLLVSSEAPEVLQVSDRIAIFRSGKLHGVVEASGATQQQIIDLAA
ncbi:hypothetical protein B5K11_28205 [Rhizobium leguminosarum bv. trifolii]|nr:hypothetical protein B5K11_28205 [Rhizobium leguminosarum bv. trifolii]